MELEFHELKFHANFFFFSSLIEHDTGGDLQNFCMTGPISRDLYKRYPDLQGLGGKKNQISKQHK